MPSIPVRSFSARYLPLLARIFTQPAKRIMRFALYSANSQATFLSRVSVITTTPIPRLRFGNQLNKRFSTSTYIQSTAANYHIGSSVGKMSDRCDIKKSEDTSLAQSDEVDCGKPKEELPKLTPAEFRVYNRLAEHMDYFVCIPSIM